jgi:hypothetical protein
MRTINTVVVIAGLVFSLTAGAEKNQTPKAPNKLEPLPRDSEVQLALSALPPHLRGNATVYVLNPLEWLRSDPQGDEWIPYLRSSNWGRHDEGLLALYGISRGHSLPNFLRRGRRQGKYASLR